MDSENEFKTETKTLKVLKLKNSTILLSELCMFIVYLNNYSLICFIQIEKSNHLICGIYVEFTTVFQQIFHKDYNF